MKFGTIDLRRGREPTTQIS